MNAAQKKRQARVQYGGSDVQPWLVRYAMPVCTKCVSALLAFSVMLVGTATPVFADTPTFTLPTTASSFASPVTANGSAIVQKKQSATARKRARKLPKRLARAKVRHTVVHAHVRTKGVKRSRGIRKVMFTPARPHSLSRGRAFGLHKTPDALALRSAVAYVVDQNTNELLFDKNSQVVLPIASISKLMTSMVVLDAQQSLTDMLQVRNADRDFEKGTHSRLSIGSRLSRADMLHIALMSSENRAASSLANYYPGGKAACVAAMNAKAQALGMYDTHFIDPTGLTSRNVSSARDLAKMVNMAYQYPLIRQFSTDASYNVFTGQKTLHYTNSNALISHHPRDWPIGVQKTGFINEAGECVVMQALVAGRPLIIVLLDSSGKYSRFADALRIRAWVTKQSLYAKRNGENESTPTMASQN